MSISYYKTRFLFDKGREKVWKAICEDLQKFIPDNSYVVDIGCGYCDFINNIRAENKIAIDISPESKKYCDNNVKFYKSSILNLNVIKEKSIDVIFMSNLLEHLTDDELQSAMKAIQRILKVNGKVIIIQPNFRYAYKEYFDDYTHKKIFTHISIADFFKSYNFNTIKVKPKYLPFSMNSRLPKSYLLTKIYLAFPIKIFAKQMLAVFEK